MVTIIYYYYIRSFDQEYERLKKSKGDVFNERIKSEINKIYDNEKKIIIEEIKSREPMTYVNLDRKINESIKKLRNIQYINDALDQEKVFNIKHQLTTKIESLSQDFEAPFIEFKIIKSEQDQFFNENINLIDIPTLLKDAKIEELKVRLVSKISEAIKNFYSQSKRPVVDKTNLIRQYAENFKLECNRYYESTLRKNHDNCIKMIETERISMHNMITNIETSTTSYNKRIIDDFSNSAKASDLRFLNFASKKYYDMYWSQFEIDVFLNNYDQVCDKSVKSCVFSIAYHQCPDCGNIWEQRMDEALDKWVGCGNYACQGRTLGCGGRSFRTNIKQGDTKNKLAQQLDYNQVERICKSELDYIKVTARTHLSSNLRKK
jgi:hypothetical protein